MTYRFFRADPIRKPEDVIDHLAESEKHWNRGRSAYELAYSWIKAGDIPGTVRGVAWTSRPGDGGKFATPSARYELMRRQRSVL